MSPPPPHHDPSDATAPGTDLATRRFRELRRRIRSSLLLRGGSRLALALLGISLVSLAIDRLFRLSLPARVVLSSLALAAIASVAWKRLLRPLGRRMTDTALAELVERRFHQLSDRLRSALEFERDPAVRALQSSQELGARFKRQSIREAMDALAPLDMADVVDLPAIVGGLAGTLAILAVASALAAASSETVTLWWRRNALFEDVEWPYRTRLVLEGFPVESREIGIARGDPFVLRVRAEGEVPDRVSAVFRYERESVRFQLPRESQGANFIHEQPEVIESFEVVAEGGDFRSRPHRVRVLERPEVTEIAATVRFVPYMRREPETARGDLGEVLVPRGATLEIEGLVSKPLASAHLECNGERLDLTLEAVKPAAGVGSAPPGPRHFRGSIVPAVDGVVAISFQDQEGVRPLQPFRFQIRSLEDKAPATTARAEGVGSMITARARIPLKLRANDDYGVVTLGVDYAFAAVGPEAADAAAATGAAELLTLPEMPPRAEESVVWDIEGLGIQPEARLDMRIWASDNDGLSGSKKGSAATQSFLVVTPERLGEDFLRREEEQRRLLERVVLEERAVRDAIYLEVDASWKEAAALPDAAIRELVGLARTERGLARQVQGISGAIRQIYDEMLNNRVEEADEAERLVSAIVEPLTDVAERSLPEAATRLGDIRETGAAVGRVEKGIALAGLVEETIQRLEQVLASMRRLEGYTEIVTRLRGILKVHEEATQATRSNYKKEIQSIFEDASPPPPEGEEPDAKPSGNGPADPKREDAAEKGSSDPERPAEPPGRGDGVRSERP